MMKVNECRKTNITWLHSYIDSREANFFFSVGAWTQDLTLATQVVSPTWTTLTAGEAHFIDIKSILAVAKGWRGCD
jgi:hypothetical protein